MLSIGQQAFPSASFVPMKKQNQHPVRQFDRSEIRANAFSLQKLTAAAGTRIIVG
jgi:hypothetical protein